MWIERAKERRKLEKRHAEQEILNSELFD